MAGTLKHGTSFIKAIFYFIFPMTYHYQSQGYSVARPVTSLMFWLNLRYFASLVWRNIMCDNALKLFLSARAEASRADNYYPKWTRLRFTGKSNKHKAWIVCPHETCSIITLRLFVKPSTNSHFITCYASQSNVKTFWNEGGYKMPYQLYMNGQQQLHLAHICIAFQVTWHLTS